MSPHEQDLPDLESSGATLVVHGAQVMDGAGGFSPATVTARDGVVVSVERGPGPEGAAPPAPHPQAAVPATASRPGPPGTGAAGRPGASVTTIDGTGLWLMPGVVDCHTHLGWTTFLPADDLAGDLPDPADRARARLARLAPGLAATLRAGVTSVRDAGGAEAATRDAVASGQVLGPTMQTAVATITDELARDPRALRARVRELVGRGAEWVKVIATGGVMSPDGAEDESPFDARDLRAVVDEAAGLGVRVMVHAWGGDALTHAVAAGVASVEHGMFLTERQAAEGAARGVVLVPTLAIYSEVAEMARRGELPERVRARAERVVEAHPRAVRRAVDAGMEIALGSDFGTTEQHGRNLVEIDHLARAGLGAVGALRAATQAGARLLGRGSGVVEAGQRLDAVLLARDPRDTAVLRDGLAVERVLLGGVTVD